MTRTNYAVAPEEYLEEWILEQGLSQQQVAGLPADSWLRYETAYRTDLERIAG